MPKGLKMTDYLDISFTVKESELMGRRLLRDLKTGQIYWAGEFVDIPPEVIVEEMVEEEIELLPIKPARKPRKPKNGA